jgi:quercetin dioxygenase-like cupin family protein
MEEKYLKNIPFNEVLVLKDLVNYSEGRVSSKTLVQRNDLSISLFAFDKGEGLSTHSAPGDAMVYVLEGSVHVTIGEDTNVVLKEGQTAVMPANVPHALKSTEKFKMLLTVVKPQKN